MIRGGKEDSTLPQRLHTKTVPYPQPLSPLSLRVSGSWGPSPLWSTVYVVKVNV